jgi:hypothetical protein
LSVRDPELALDLDLAVAQRCHHMEQDELRALMDEDKGGFFSAVIALLNRR